MSKLSKEKEQEILDLLRRGVPRFSEIARVVGCSNSPVKRLAKKYGFKNDYRQQEYEERDDYALIHIMHHDIEYLIKIDIDDIERCKSFGKWCINSAGYVLNGNTGMPLSRFIMDCPDGLEVDHINHDVLDNRKHNLRIVTGQQNHFNQGLSKTNKSGHRGVSWSKQRKKWCVHLHKKGERVAKRFETYEGACSYADEIMDKWHGEFRYDHNRDVTNEVCGSN